MTNRHRDAYGRGQVPTSRKGRDFCVTQSQPARPRVASVPSWSPDPLWVTGLLGRGESRAICPQCPGQDAAASPGLQPPLTWVQGQPRPWGVPRKCVYSWQEKARDGRQGHGQGLRVMEWNVILVIPEDSKGESSVQPEWGSKL